jgi:hypothetical protein
MDSFFLGVIAIFTIVNTVSNLLKLGDISCFLGNINKMIEENQGNFVDGAEEIK